MISVIVCSADDAKMKAVEAMYVRALAGTNMEFVGIRSPKSITGGYNHGAAASTGDILIFSHDDVEIFSENTVGIIQQTLKEYDLLGVAGTTRLVYPKWLTAGPPYIHGQILHPGKVKGAFALNIFNAPRRLISNVQALDGVFMACRRELWQSNPFDETTFDGFHLYDLDFSYGAYQAGRKLCVRNDIFIYHASAGDYTDPNWKVYADRFTKKHGSKFPKHWIRPYQWAGTFVRNWNEARELMTPPYWDDK